MKRNWTPAASVTLVAVLSLLAWPWSALLMDVVISDGRIITGMVVSCIITIIAGAFAIDPREPHD